MLNLEKVPTKNEHVPTLITPYEHFMSLEFSLVQNAKKH